MIWLYDLLLRLALCGGTYVSLSAPCRFCALSFLRPVVSAPCRFCALSFLLIFLLASLPVHAQYNGGGWVQQKRPGGPVGFPYYLDGAYDWTGLSVFRQTTSTTGTTTTFQAQAGTAYDIAGIGRIAVGSNSGESFDISVAGTSTYQWLWSPPSNNVVLDPPPPLYGLAKITFNQIAAVHLGTDNTVTAYAQITDGWGWSSSFNALPGMLPTNSADNPRWRVVGPATAAGSNVQLPVSPSLAATMSWGGGNDNGALGGSFRDDIFPITLAAPSPFGHPDQGDGSNQYVYDPSQPNGQLTVPASVYVPGTSTPDTTFLLPHIALSVSPVMQTGAQPFVWTASDAGMFVSTTGTRPGYNSSWPTGDFCYLGLPPDNSYFGNHVMTMLVDGTASQTAKYQLFFSKNGQNFPDCDPTRQVNWYHYYNLVYPSPDDDPSVEVDATYNIGLNQYGETEWYPPANYNPNTPYGYGLFGWTAGVTIGNQAGGATSLPIFDLGGPNGLVRYVGDLYVKGIQTYVLTCAHETAHRTLMQAGIYYPYDPADGPPYGFVDNDGDHVNDTWEAAHHLDPTDSDTTGRYASNPAYGYGDTGDLECLCEISAFKELLAKQALWQQDWSDGGLQKGVVPSPNFYWQFRPAVAAADYAVGTTYQVKTLSDLSQRYPTVLSDLP